MSYDVCFEVLIRLSGWVEVGWVEVKELATRVHALPLHPKGRIKLVLEMMVCIEMRPVSSDGRVCQGANKHGCSFQSSFFNACILSKDERYMIFIIYYIHPPRWVQKAAPPRDWCPRPIPDLVSARCRCGRGRLPRVLRGGAPLVAGHSSPRPRTTSHRTT